MFTFDTGLWWRLAPLRHQRQLSRSDFAHWWRQVDSNHRQLVVRSSHHRQPRNYRRLASAPHVGHKNRYHHRGLLARYPKLNSEQHIYLAWGRDIFDKSAPKIEWCTQRKWCAKREKAQKKNVSSFSLLLRCLSREKCVPLTHELLRFSLSKRQHHRSNRS